MVLHHHGAWTGGDTAEQVVPAANGHAAGRTIGLQCGRIIVGGSRPINDETATRRALNPLGATCPCDAWDALGALGTSDSLRAKAALEAWRTLNTLRT
jgi:hypothetical protein